MIRTCERNQFKEASLVNRFNLIVNRFKFQLNRFILESIQSPYESIHLNWVVFAEYATFQIVCAQNAPKKSVSTHKTAKNRIFRIIIYSLGLEGLRVVVSYSSIATKTLIFLVFLHSFWFCRLISVTR